MKKYLSQQWIPVVVTTAIITAAGIVSAWTGPTAAPPGNNTSAPVNVSSASQVKSGGFWASSIGSDSGFCIGTSCISSWPTSSSGSVGPWATSTGGTIYYNGGNVGVGTNNPATPLDVLAAGKRAVYLRGSDADYTIPITFVNSSVPCTSGGVWGLGVNGGAPATFSSMPVGSFWIHQDCVGPHFVITPSGNIGIGTQNPGYPLTIAGGGANNWTAVINWPPSSAPGFGILVGTNAIGYSQFQNASGYYTLLADASYGLYTNGNVYTTANVSAADVYSSAGNKWLSQAARSNGARFTVAQYNALTCPTGSVMSSSASCFIDGSGFNYCTGTCQWLQ